MRSSQLSFLAVLIFALSLPAQAAYVSFQLKYEGHPDSTEAYAFAFPTFTLTNTSTAGININSFSMGDGTANGLWDYVTNETSSAGVGNTLTSGDRTNNSGWHSSIAYSFTGMEQQDFMRFAVDPDTYHSGTGNVIDSRPFLFGAGDVAVSFSNGQSLNLTWQANPTKYVFEPLRVGTDTTDDRNIYYLLEGRAEVPENSVPEPASLALLGLGLAGLGASRRSKQK